MGPVVQALCPAPVLVCGGGEDRTGNNGWKDPRTTGGGGGGDFRQSGQLPGVEWERRVGIACAADWDGSGSPSAFASGRDGRRYGARDAAAAGGRERTLFSRSLYLCKVHAVRIHK